MDPALSSQLLVVLEPVDEMSVQELLFRESSTQALSEYEPAVFPTLHPSVLTSSTEALRPAHGRERLSFGGTTK